MTTFKVQTSTTNPTNINNHARYIMTKEHITENKYKALI